ncbi:hypothetical protein [Aquimarina longa]|uniref:hypothetical protein n=1 Tax=Aquimarina longa TaxID=1080221 RepID=UPI000B0A0F27|nr:hypothetical protein [Aquimarina longa]
MKNTFLNIVLIILLIACKNTPDTTVSKVVTPKEKSTPVNHQQTKDTAKQKTAIEKTFDNKLSQLEEFKKYSDVGWHTIIDQTNEKELNNKYSNFALHTLETIEKIREGVSRRKGVKYIVMVNGNKIVNYTEIDYTNIPKGSQYYIDGIQYKGKIDKELVAFAKSWDEDEEEIITEIYKVYRADKETGKILEIPTDGVTIIADYWRP